MKNSLVLLFILFFCIHKGYSQELNCQVQVLSSQVQATEKRIFQTLETAIFEFMNNTKWTKDIFTNDERIECNIQINVSEKNNDDFKATIQVQSRRPIFKTSYNSTLLNYNDNNFPFKYLESQPLEFSENTNVSNLTSVLAYYAYLIIGLDYDSYSLNGGTPYYQKAQTIVNNAQSAAEPGWKAFEDTKNRYWFISNIMDPVFAPLRECLYKYHRLGLDIMVSGKEEGRHAIAASILLLENIHQNKPGSFNLQVFFNAKADEIVNLFSPAFPDEKAKVVNVLNEIDPGNSNKYQKIMNSNE